MAVSFDLFGTLVAVDRPDDPAAAVAGQLRDRGVAVPDDWADAYSEAHVELSAGRELPLAEHVGAALASRGVDADGETVATAVCAAFDDSVRTREGASTAIAAAAEQGPVGVLSNCSVTGLVDRAIDRSALDSSEFDAVVASVDCGWRKPDPRAFDAVADALGVERSALVHVGDDPATDGGAADCGAESVLLSEAPLSELSDYLEGSACR